MVIYDILLSINSFDSYEGSLLKFNEYKKLLFISYKSTVMFSVWLHSV